MSKLNAKPQNPLWQTSKPERSSYYMYFFGQNMIYNLVAAYLATFLLLIGINPVKSAAVMLVVKVWDAVNDVLIGNMSFVGPRPDVPGYADQLQGDDRKVLKLRPGITGPATLKYRLEDEMIAGFVADIKDGRKVELGNATLPENVSQMTDQELAVWYNDNVIYPDKVRLNKYYYEHYSFIKDIEMIFATVLGFKVKFAGEEI